MNYLERELMDEVKKMDVRDKCRIKTRYDKDPDEEEYSLDVQKYRTLTVNHNRGASTALPNR